jgi:hypothetical protein
VSQWYGFRCGDAVLCPASDVVMGASPFLSVFSVETVVSADPSREGGRSGLSSGSLLLARSIPSEASGRNTFLPRGNRPSRGRFVRGLAHQPSADRTDSDDDADE